MQFTGLDQALETAVIRDDALGVRTAVQAGAQPNARGRHNVTPLSYAIGIRSRAAVKALIELGADPNLKSNSGSSATSLAAALYRTDPDLLRLLLDAGADPNITGPGDRPLILTFIDERNLEAITYLHAKGADLDVVYDGRPLIVDAARGVDWDVVAHMMDLGAKMDTPLASSELVATFTMPVSGVSPDSPLYPPKIRVWRRLKALGYNPNPPIGMEREALENPPVPKN